MKLLALETSTIACSVALRCGEEMLERHVVKAKEHTRLLLPMIRELLAEAGVRASGLDGIVLGNGPGSFIGVRIAASVAQGLAYGAGVGIVPVSSLAAVAAEAFERSGAERVLVAQDAHMNEVYLAGYRRGAGRLPLADGAAVVQPAGRFEWPGVGPGSKWHAAGAGWQRYPDLLRMNAGRIAAVVDVQLPRALFLLGAGAALWQEGKATAPMALEPDYVRARVAQVPAPR